VRFIFECGKGQEFLWNGLVSRVAQSV
jgi:hypothetical protein